jgi:hypothetical protein
VKKSTLALKESVMDGTISKKTYREFAARKALLSRDHRERSKSCNLTIARHYN